MLSDIWQDLPASFSNFEVTWRGVEQLAHRQELGHVEVLDKCLVYQNADGASNADVIFRARKIST